MQSVHFQVDIRGVHFDSYSEGTVTLGHEVFVHAEKYADAISLLMKEVERKNLSSRVVAKRLRRIKQDRGYAGKNDHREYGLGQNSSIEKYFRELLQYTTDSIVFRRHINALQSEIARDRSSEE